MTQLSALVFTCLLLIITNSCNKNEEKVNIHITNNRNNTIKVEFRAGDTVCSGTYVAANSTQIDEAFPGEYDVYVSDWDGMSGTDGPFFKVKHGLFYKSDNYLTVN
ncbi:MAG: hypothetical protein PHT69_16790 [Bacteroidales bacterium]|nr:hypothetical protein [Bacteroidales bacterium]